MLKDIEKGGFLGSLLIDDQTKVILSDVSVYRFLGQSSVNSLIEFIHNDDKALLLDLISSCDDTFRSVTARCLDADGKYKKTVFVVYNMQLFNAEYIRVSLYDPTLMAQTFKEYEAADTAIKTCADLADEVFFLYNTQNKTISLYKNGKSFYTEDFMHWRRDMISDGYIAGDYIEYFHNLCEDIRQANGSGYYTLNTALFTGGKKNGFSKTSVSICVLAENAVPVCTAGIISKADFPDVSNYDPLTGLYNKSVIKKLACSAIEKSLRDNTSVVFAIIDLDHFKEVNDTYGHLVGDKALLNTARIIKSCIGEHGICGRIGGDEFFVILHDYSGNSDELRLTLRSVRTHIQLFFKHFKENIEVTCSIGSVCCPKDADNYNDLFKLADFCLYRAKSKGRNRYIFFRPDVHGPAENIINKSGSVSPAGNMSDEEKTAHLLQMIEFANTASDTEQPLQSIISEIRQHYFVNTFQFCPVGTDINYQEVTDREIIDPRAPIKLYDTYKSWVDEAGCFSLGDYENAKGFLPELSAFMENNRIYSILVVPFIDDKDNFKGIFTLGSDIQYIWSWADILNLRIICNVISKFL